LKAGTFFANARNRAKRRKSPWNLILIPLCLGSAIAINCGLFMVVWAFHTYFYPAHQLNDFWQPGISGKSFVPSFLMVFALLPGSIAAGFMVGNALAWLVAPARRTFEAEARGYPGTSFRAAMSGLFALAVIALPIGLVISLASAYFLPSLQ
jgi:hypothetical protein